MTAASERQRLPRWVIPAFGTIWILVLIAGVLFYRSERREFGEGANGSLRAVTQLKVELLQQWLHERMRDVETVSGNEALQEEAIRFIDTRTLDGVSLEVGHWMRAMHAGYDYESVHLVSADGSWSYSVPEGRSASTVALPSLLATVRRSGKAAMSDLYRDPATARVWLDFAAPLRRPDGSFAGAVILRVDPNSFLFGILRRWPTDQPSYEAVLLRLDGQTAVVLSPLQGRSTPPLTYRRLLTASQREAIQTSRESERSLQLVDDRGKATLAQILPVRGTAWLLLVKIDRARAFAPVRQMVLAALAIALLMALASGLAIRLIGGRRAARASVEGEERLQQIIDRAPPVIFVKDVEGTYRLVNRAFEETTGVSREQAIGRRASDIFPPEIAQSLDAEHEAIATRNVVESTDTMNTTRGLRHFILVYFPLFNPKGALSGVGGIATDITSVRDAQEELTSVINSTPDIIVRLDRDRRILLVNPAVEPLTGVPPERLVGMSVLGNEISEEFPADSPWPEIRERWLGEVDASFSDGRMRQFELTQIDFGHGSRDFEIRLVPEPAGETIPTILSFARDITERRRAAEAQSQLREQLDQAERLNGLGHLAATVAHEFNNVLMGIGPFTEVLRRQNPGSPTIQKATDHISNSIVRGTRITQGVLRYARPVEPVLTTLSIHEWLPKLYSTIAPLLGDAVTLHEAELGDSLYVTADAAQLHQVFVNLVQNAREAIGEGGNVTVTVRRPAPGETFPFGGVPHAERFVQFTIADDGKGMEPYEVKRIFEPLYSTKRAGTGLGLAVAHQIVSRHGGYIFGASKPRVGTELHVFIPSSVRPLSPAREPAPIASATVREVLLVEDEPAVAAGIAALLDEIDIDLRTASTGADGLAMFRALRPDAVILDIGLPDMDGTELFGRIREVDATIPIVVSTGHADQARLGAILDEPLVAHLMKPYDTPDLVRAFLALGLTTP